MAAPEIIIACLGISFLLMLCLTCFVLFIYSKARSRIRHTSRGVKPAQVKAIPPAPKPAVEEPTAVITQRRREATEVDEEEEGKRNEGQKISVPESTKRPTELRIDTEKACPAQSAIAMETDYSADSFLATVAKDSVNRRRLLEDEFLVLSRTMARRLNRSTDIARRHASANRYSDIVPYDHTLVELSGGDYINASFVQGESDALRWIATQAPIDSGEEIGRQTLTDFWHMIVQYDVACIVMLGQHHENFVQKCGKYWPAKIGKTERYGNVEVKVVCELEEKCWVHREFDVSATSSNSSKRGRRGGSHVKVSHWHYSEWKDNEVPVTESFLEFLLQIRRRRYTSPIVVHCSAGIGRTGVFICTDNVISRFESEGIIDIFNEVNRSRQQRPCMVFTQTQYECIYDTIGEYLRQKK